MSLRRHRFIPFLRAHGAAVLFIGAYLGATLWYLGRYACGDVGTHPVGYFFIWDMFPSHSSLSFRRVAVGRTRSGEFVQVVPSGLQQYRGGVRRDRSRVDLERGGQFFQTVAERTVEVTGAQAAADPLVELQFYEQYWPAKFNYPPDLYERWAGTPKPDRHYWRRLATVDLTRPPIAEPAAGGDR